MAQPGDDRFFRVFATWVLRLRIPLLLVVLATSAWMGFQVQTNLRIDNSIEYISSGHTDAMDVLHQYRADFGRDETYFVLIEGDVFSLGFLERLKALHEELETIDVALTGEEEAPEEPQEEEAEEADDGWGDDDGWGTDEGWGEEEGGTVIEEVTSLVNARQTLGSAGTVRVQGFLDDWPPSAEELPDLEAHATTDPGLVGRVVSEDATYALIHVRSQVVGNEEDSKLINRAVWDVVEEHTAPGFHARVTGSPELNDKLNTTVVQDTQRLVRVAFVVMATILFVLFRNGPAVLAPLIVVALSAVWTLGAMAWTDTPFTVITNILPGFLAAVGLGDSVHVLSVYRDERKSGMDNHQAIIEAISSTGRPILFTTLTTMAGLLSFRAASSIAIQEMGTFGALGVGMALVFSVVLLPIVLSWNRWEMGGARRGEKGDAIDRLLMWTASCSSTPRKRNLTLLAGVGVLALALAGAAQLRVYHNPLTWLGEDHPTAVSFADMDEHIGGTAAVQLVIDAPGDLGVKDLEVIQGMEKLEEHIRTYEHPTYGEIVTDTVSLLDVVRETNRALHDGQEAFYTIPDSQRALSDTMLMFENAGPAELRRLATGDLERTHLTVRITWLDATAYQPLSEHIQAGIDKYMPEGTTVRRTGSVYLLISVVASLIGDLTASLSVAVLTVTVMMILLLQNLKLGLISMVPNLLPIALVIGFMGWTGITLDLSNLLIASIVIGVAVDDTVHYLHQYRMGRRTGDTDSAIDHALNHAGRALVSTSIILGLGFMVYLASRIIYIQRFGVLTGIALAAALFSNLIFAPALLRLFFGKR